MTTSRMTDDERWAFAADRVYLKDIRITQIAGTSNRYVASSGSCPQRVYLVTGMRDCTCAAGIGGDKVCLHRAAVGLKLGLIDETPFPEVAA